MRALILAVVLAGAPWIIPPSFHEPSTSLHLNDDKPLTLGNTSTTWDAAFEWDTAATPDGLRLYLRAILSDAAPGNVVFTSQPVYVAPGATNVTGSDIIISPSIGERTLEGVTKANTTGDTLTFKVWSNGTATSTVKTEGSASPDGWDCDGAASDAACVCNLYDLLVGAGAISGVTVTRTDATCSDEKLTFSLTPGTSELMTVTTSDDTNLDMTAGNDGRIIIPDGKYQRPGFGFASANTTGPALISGAIYWHLGGVSKVVFESASLTLASSYGLQLASAGRIFNSGAVLILGSAFTTGHSLTGGDVGTAGKLEVDGMFYPDGGIQGDVSIAAASGKGALTKIRTKTESVTFASNPGDASKVTTGSIIPAGAFVTNVTTRITTGATNCASVDIGIAGTDTDMFADGTAVADETTTTNADANSGADWGASILPSFGAQEITVTANGGNCFDGVWAITVHYIDASAATAD